MDETPPWGVGDTQLPTPLELTTLLLETATRASGPPGAYARALKPLLDFLAALLLLILAAPLIGLTALAIKLDSPGPIFLRQTRIGLGGRRFQMLKLRSMVDGAERESGPVWAQPDDPRITALGRWLRAYRLDELPQLVNVLRGEMSVVGPRPERPAFVRRLSLEIPAYTARHAVKPGMTGQAQVCYKYAASSHETAVKLLFDLDYIANLSLGRDLKILLRTIPVVLARRGAA